MVFFFFFCVRTAFTWFRLPTSCKSTQRTTSSSSKRVHYSLVQSPWYNRTGWLGVKHQVIYLLTYSLSGAAGSSSFPFVGALSLSICILKPRVKDVKFRGNMAVKNMTKQNKTGCTWGTLYAYLPAIMTVWAFTSCIPSDGGWKCLCMVIPVCLITDMTVAVPGVHYYVYMQQWQYKLLLPVYLQTAGESVCGYTCVPCRRDSGRTRGGRGDGGHQLWGSLLRSCSCLTSGSGPRHESYSQDCWRGICCLGFVTTLHICLAHEYIHCRKYVRCQFLYVSSSTSQSPTVSIVLLLVVVVVLVLPFFRAGIHLAVRCGLQRLWERRWSSITRTTRTLLSSTAPSSLTAATTRCTTMTPPLPTSASSLTSRSFEQGRDSSVVGQKSLTQ